MAKEQFEATLSLNIAGFVNGLRQALDAGARAVSSFAQRSGSVTIRAAADTSRAENDLRGLNRAAGTTASSSTASLSKIRADVDTSAFDADLRKMEREASESGSKISSSLSGKGGGGGLGGLLGGGLGGAVGLAGVGLAVTGITKAMIDGNAEMEQYQTAFNVLLGSADKAESLLGEIKEFAAGTPFEFPELAAASRNLIAFGFSAQETVPELKKIGDISSGVGANIGELAELYGKARVSGTLYAEDINQLVGRGIPVIQEFAKQMGVSESEVKKLASEGKLTFTNLQQAFTDLTAEGGKFNGMMEAQSQTFEGLKSTFQDTLGQVVRDLGGPIFEAAKSGLTKLLDVFGSEDFQKAIGQLGEVFGAILGPLADTLTGLVAPLVSLIGPLASTITSILGPIGGILGTVTTAVAGIVTALSGPLASVLNLVGGLLSRVFGAIGKTLEKLLPQVLGFLDPLFSILDGVFIAIAPLVDVFGQLAEAIIPLFAALNPLAILGQILGPVLEALAPVVTELVTSLALLATSLLEAILPVIELLVPLITGLVGLLADGLAASLVFLVDVLVGPLVSAISAIVSGLADFVDGVVEAVDWIIEAGDSVGDFLSPVLNVLWSILKGLAGFIGSVVVGVFDALVSVVGDVASAVGDVLAPIFEGFVSTVSAIASAVSTFVSYLWESSGAADAVSAAVSAAGDVFDFVKGIIEKVANIVKGAEEGFRVFGEAISAAFDSLTSFDIGGFFENLIGGFGRAAEAAEDYADTVDRIEKGSEHIGEIVSGVAGVVFQAGQAQITALKGITDVSTLDSELQRLVDGFEAGLSSAPTEDFKKAYTELIRLAEEAAETRRKALQAQADPPPGGDKPPPAPAKATAPKTLDFTDDARKSIQEATAITNEIEIAAVAERLEQVRAEFRERRRLLDQEIEDKKSANQKKLDEARASLKAGQALEVKGFQEAQAALDRLQEAKRAEAEAEERKAIQEAAKAVLEERLKTDQEANKRRLDELKTLEESVTATSAAELERRKDLRLQAIDLENRQALERYVRTLPEYSKFAEDLASRLQEGTISAEEIGGEFDRFLDTLSESNSSVTALLDRQRRERARAELEIDDEIASRRVEGIASAAERERETRLLELRKRLREELAAAGDNERLITEAKRRAEAERYEIEQDYNRRSNIAYQIGESLKLGIHKAFISAISEIDREAFEEKKGQILQERQLLEENVLLGVVGAKEAARQRAKLDRDLADLTEELEGRKGNFGQQAAKALAAAFKDMREAEGTGLEATLDKTVATFETASKSGAIGIEDAWSVTVGLAEKNLAVLGSKMAETLAGMIETGEYNLKAFGQLALQQAIEMARQMILIYTPQILAASVSLLGPIAGPIASGFLIASVQALLSAAESSVLSLSDGISSVPGRASAGDSVPAMLTPEERVVPVRLNRKYWHYLEMIQRDIDPTSAVAARLRPALSSILVAVDGSFLAAARAEQRTGALEADRRREFGQLAEKVDGTNNRLERLHLRLSEISGSTRSIAKRRARRSLGRRKRI